MLHPLTEPSTPLRRITRPQENYAMFSAPPRLAVGSVHLPPQELSTVLSHMALQSQPSTKRRRIGLGTSFGGYLRPPGSATSTNLPSRAQSPARRLSEHLTIRRRRRSSTGILYESGYSSGVSIHFLRAFSKALVESRRRPPEELNDQVYLALDSQHRLTSRSPSELALNEFEYSLPLPSDSNLSDLDSGPIQPTSTELTPPPAPAKVTAKSYLERILESRSQKRVHSAAAETSTDLQAVMNLKFEVENTLSGLPDTFTGDPRVPLKLQLAEPVAFGSLHEQASSNESSEKENALPETFHVRPLLPSRLAAENETPINFSNVTFENINQLDIPNWEEIHMYKDRRDSSSSPHARPESPNVSPDGLIMGHFTIDYDDISHHDSWINQDQNADTPVSLSPHLPDASLASPRTGTVETTNYPDAPSRAPPPLAGPVTRITTARAPRSEEGSSMPSALVKSLIALTKPLSLINLKKTKTRMGQLAAKLIAAKSTEFLQQVMADLEAFSDHRGSDQIDISDVSLLLKRTQSRLSLHDINYATMAHNLLPLELMVSLDNSLEVHANKMRQQASLYTRDSEAAATPDREDSFSAKEESDSARKDSISSNESGYSE